jgi:hypothetical protein
MAPREILDRGAAAKPREPVYFIASAGGMGGSRPAAAVIYQAVRAIDHSPN